MSLKAVQQQYNEALAKLQELDRAISDAVAVNGQASYIIDESSLRFQRRRHAEVVDMHRRMKSTAIPVSGVLQHYRNLCDRLADCEKSLQQLLA